MVKKMLIANVNILEGVCTVIGEHCLSLINLKLLAELVVDIISRVCALDNYDNQEPYVNLTLKQNIDIYIPRDEAVLIDELKRKGLKVNVLPIECIDVNYP